MRLDLDFRGGGGFVVARNAFALALPESYAFCLHIRGVAPSNIFEFKLEDASGQNVWRYRQKAFGFPMDWQPLTITSSQIEFGWGPVACSRMPKWRFRPAAFSALKSPVPSNVRRVLHEGPRSAEPPSSHGTFLARTFSI
jgi:hypothetical protein